METFYLVDFENVHNKGIEGISNESKNSHIHVFSTKKASNINSNAFWLKDVHGHRVPVGDQSVDMHLVSYLGFLLCKHGKNNEYIIVSKDTDYDNIITFWKKEGYNHIERKPEIPKKEETKTATKSPKKEKTKTATKIPKREETKTATKSPKKEKTKTATKSPKKEETKTATKIPKKEETEREREVRSLFNELDDVKFISKNKEEIIDIIVKAQTKQEAETELKKLHKQNPCNIGIWIVAHILRIMKL